MERRESEGKGFAHLQGELTAADDVESGVEDREGSAIAGGRSGGDGGGDVGKGEIVFGGKAGEGLEGSRRRDAGAKEDRKSTRLNSSHSQISYAVFCLKKKNLEIDYFDPLWQVLR